MNKEPIGLYIFRYILGFGLFAFMAMLYWSSLLIESDVKSIKQDLVQLQENVEKIRVDVLKAAANTSKVVAVIPQAAPQTTAFSKTEQQTAYPNLLESDPFYEKTLPEMLGDNFHPSGTLMDSTYGKPENLHPFAGFVDVMQLLSRCNITVAQLKFGIYETLAPSAAERMEERMNPETQLPEYWVFLRKDLFWEPLEQRFFGDNLTLAPHFLKKHPVTANDFKLYWDAVMNPYVSEPGAVSRRTYYSDISSIDIIDDYTFVVRWAGKDVKQPDGTVKKSVKYSAKELTGGMTPLASFVYTYFADGSKIIEDDKDPSTYRKSSVWAQNFAQHWAKNIIPSCGAWKFDEKTDQRIVLKRNPNFYQPLNPLIQIYELTYRPSSDAVWQEFKAGNVTETVLQPEKLTEWENFQKSSMYAEQKARNFGINQLEYLNRSYTYLAWNQKKPFFDSKKVRQALTMAIDRKRIVSQNLNNLAVEIHGSFFVESLETDKNIQPYPFDPVAARKLLEEEGWTDTDGDGILDKEINGKRAPFSFKLTYYVKNPVTKSSVEYVATALKEVGIDCQLDGVDIADLSAKIDDKSYDAYYLAWGLGTPPSDPRQLWYSTYANVKGSSNTVGFSNAEADKIIDQLDVEYDKQKRLELYHRFDAIMHDEQPYTFMYTPKVIMLYREVLQNVFIPSKRQDLIPGATVNEPIPTIFWLKEGK